MTGSSASRDLSSIPRLLERGEIEAARSVLARLGDSGEDPMRRVCEIMIECAAGRTDRAEVLLSGADGMLRSATMRVVNHFFLRLFSFHLDRGEIGCARRILDAGSRYGLGWRDFGLAYVRFCDRASLAREGLTALRAYYPGLGAGDPGLQAALQLRYPFLTGLPESRKASGR